MGKNISSIFNGKKSEHYMLGREASFLFQMSQMVESRRHSYELFMNNTACKDVIAPILEGIKSDNNPEDAMLIAEMAKSLENFNKNIESTIVR